MAQDPDPDHLDLVEMVRKISDSSDQTYGERRMSRALKALGYEAGIWVRYRKNYRVTTNLRGGYQTQVRIPYMDALGMQGDKFRF